MVDWPKTARWLIDADRDLIAGRIAHDAGTFRMDQFDSKAMKRCFLGWKIRINIFIYVGTVNTTTVSTSSKKCTQPTPRTTPKHLSFPFSSSQPSTPLSQPSVPIVSATASALPWLATSSLVSALLCCSCKSTSQSKFAIWHSISLTSAPIPLSQLSGWS